mmetsp:Transcript_10973/g.21176  ORF Transcript_10973/g.21176 Transcript_10973/m.21176 type:complete len:229 (-) Transcript_10973:133-819(-)
MNPNSTKFLRANLRANAKRFRGKCLIYEMDCNDAKLEDIADTVNLGLLPTSEDGYVAAIKALKKDGGVLHVHETVYLDGETTLDNEAQTLAVGMTIGEQLNDIIHRIKYPMKWQVSLLRAKPVKSYAPHVCHMVYDFFVTPKPPDAKQITRAALLTFASNFARIMAVLAVFGAFVDVRRQKRIDEMKEEIKQRSIERFGEEAYKNFNETVPMRRRTMHVEVEKPGRVA